MWLYICKQAVEMKAQRLCGWGRVMEECLVGSSYVTQSTTCHMLITAVASCVQFHAALGIRYIASDGMRSGRIGSLLTNHRRQLSLAFHDF